MVFDCGTDQLLGVLTRPMQSQAATMGVMIVVGGPQYRIGSHRQFVHLARFLASEGYAAFRFDYRGMGDSGGTMRTFESVEPDLHAAVEAFRASCPSMQRIVLFGLCDAASAILLAAPRLPRVHALILANPWVRQEHSLNRAVVRHYYRQRLLSGEFWRKLLSGRVSPLVAGSEFLGRIRSYVRRETGSQLSLADSFVDKMLLGWQLPTRKLLLLSGRDLTASEFNVLRTNDRRWRAEAHPGSMIEDTLADADHTFSSSNARDSMHASCRKFLAQIA